MISKQAQNKAITDILSSYTKIGGINHLDGTNLPSRESIKRLLNRIKELLFPGFFEHIQIDSHNLTYVTGQKVVEVMDRLAEEVEKSFIWAARIDKKSVKGIDISKRSADITLGLIKEIPQIRKCLKEDVSAIFSGDPASKSEEEIILSYPGFQAISVYRISHYLFQKGVPLIPRIMAELIHSDTGIDIHPGAKIGRRFCIDHGTGIVVGETSVLGDDVKLYQGVTIGALSVPDRNLKGKRHPTLENNVTVYARTTILGGKTVIGENTIIGGNVWITKSVPANSKFYLSDDRKQILKVDK